MAKLRIKSERADSPEIELRPGVITIGRHPDNAFAVADPSVSSFHCEVTVTDNGATVKDRNSTNGTFIDNQPVQEAALHPGQTLRLGAVDFVYEADERSAGGAAAVGGASIPAARPVIRLAIGRASPTAPPPVSVEEAAVAVAAGGAAIPEDSAAPPLAPPLSPCHNHPRLSAEFICKQCRQMLCAACVKTRQAGGKTKWDCPTCRGQCVPLVDFQESERQRSAKEAQSFFQRLPGAFNDRR